MDSLFKFLGAIAALTVVVVVAVYIWRWGAKYKTGASRTAAVLMIVGLWFGIGVRGGFVIFVVGLVVMLLERKKAASNKPA